MCHLYWSKAVKILAQNKCTDRFLNHRLLFFFFHSQRLVPDSGVWLLCMDPAGGRGMAQSSPHTALDCTRPLKIKPTLLLWLTTLHISFPQSSGWRWSGLPSEVNVVLNISPKAMYVCEWKRVSECVLSQYSERSSCLVGTVATAMSLLSRSSKLTGFRLRRQAVMTLSNWGDNKPISSVLEWVSYCCMCVGVFFSCQDSTGINYTPSAWSQKPWKEQQPVLTSP